ncbi:MAG: helix-turn-helix domain-containing protein [Lachnospiraceae bacterium]|nr:helix-turn-helix domain-containing protein [Lachnospiraceae bacterium]
MTKQAVLKKQAYASTLKCRALSVLIYLIDRSNKDLTCFPAISTIAEQLHISESTVKRALWELVDKGYIKKDARFREKSKGQTSNLYTLVLFENQGKTDNICPETLEKCEASAEISGKLCQQQGIFRQNISILT